MGDFKNLQFKFFSFHFLGANSTPPTNEFATKSYSNGHSKASASL